MRDSTSHIADVYDRARRRVARVRHDGLAPDVPAEHLAQFARSHRPYLTVAFRCERLTPETIGVLNANSELGCVNVYTDSPFVIPGNSAVRMFDSLREYRAVLTFAKSLLGSFRQLGARHVAWLPFGYHPALNRPTSDAGKHAQWDVTFAGTWGPLQERWLERLLDLDLRIFGRQWHHLSRGSQLRARWRHGQGLGSEMAEVIGAARVTVNFVRAEHGCAHSMKTFEIPASGGFMLTNDTEEQRLFFQGDEECVYFDSPEEMAAKAKFYISHHHERARIRLAGMRAVAPHTYLARAKGLLRFLERGDAPFTTG